VPRYGRECRTERLIQTDACAELERTIDRQQKRTSQYDEAIRMGSGGHYDALTIPAFDSVERRSRRTRDASALIRRRGHPVLTYPRIL
jgi:hypothetical protein